MSELEVMSIRSDPERFRDVRAWLLARYVTAAAPYLNRDFDDARYEFFGVVLTGQARPRERWKRGVSMVSNFLGDALGKLYVEKHFPPTTKKQSLRSPE